MQLATQILIGLVALLHLYFLWFEMFAWNTVGRSIFRNFPREMFKHTKVMAANQGLYNGFLAAGLIWTFFIEDPIWRINVALFFLSCVAVAGIFATFTVARKVFYVQALPAIIAIVLIAVQHLI